MKTEDIVLLGLGGGLIYLIWKGDEALSWLPEGLGGLGGGIPSLDLSGILSGLKFPDFTIPELGLGELGINVKHGMWSNYQKAQTYSNYLVGK